MMIKPSPNIEYLQHPHIYTPKELSIGKRLVILAEADEGPLYEPVLVYHNDMAANFFKGGDLIRSYQDACVFKENIPAFLMRIEPGEYDIAFGVLEAFSFDLLFLNEIHFNRDEEVINSFLKLCRTKEEQGNLVHGITTLESSEIEDVLLLSSKINELATNFGDDVEETGKYLSLVTNQIEYYDAGAVYAGILTSLDPEVNPVNKKIKNVSLSKEYTKEEIKYLQASGVVCFRNTFKNGVTCASSSCAVITAGSVHKHISNFRIAQYLINQVSMELRPFVGGSNPTFQAMDIESIVDSICIEHVSLNRLRDYNYQIVPNDFYGNIEVKIEIVPIFSVHSITTHSRVRILK